MLSIAALSGGQGNYYLALARDDYYVKGGEPPGEWLGEGARLLGLTGAVEGQAFKNLLAGLSADGEKSLVQGAGSGKHQPGWDLTLSCPKSVSVLWSQAAPDVRKEIEEAVREAARETVDYLQETAAYTRRGKGGQEREPTKLVVAAFEHGTSRAQDPQLHVHCVVVNVGVRADGTTGTIVSKPLYVHKMPAGAQFRMALANQLEKRLGVVVERPINPTSGRVESWFEVKGVPKGLVQEFSKRREQVERALLEHHASGAKAAATLTLATRQAKEHLPRGELLRSWQEVGRNHGFTAEGANALLRQQGHRQDLAGRVRDCIGAALERITLQESHFSERELVRRAAEEAQDKGVAASVLRHVVKQELARSPEFVCLGRVNGEIHYTTREVLDLEKKMLAQVEGLRCRPVEPLAAETIHAVEGSLSHEQKKALRHLTQAGGSIRVVSGMAGTGKTSMLRAAREALESEGFDVIGACLSGKAAQGLQEGAGIKSSTIAKLIGIPELNYRGELGKGRFERLKEHASHAARAALGQKTRPPDAIRLTAKTVLVIDEAGMVATRQMERLTGEVLKAGGRLLLVGDEKQLQPIDAGGPFGSIGERVGRVTLTDIKRQREPWAREAIKRIAVGEAWAALVEYVGRGLVFVAEDRKEAMRAVITSWKHDGVSNPRDNLILASTNAEITLLNRMAQTQRLLAGGLGKQALGVAGSEFHCGDRVLFTRNSKRYGVQNGSLGTVTEVDVARQVLTVQLDKGKSVLVPVNIYAHLKLGYAMTTHKSQGATTESAYVLLGGPTQDRELSYVQASRARGTTRFFLDKLEAGEELEELCKQLERSRQKDLAHDLLERQGREGVESRNTLVQRIE